MNSSATVSVYFAYRVDDEFPAYVSDDFPIVVTDGEVSL